MPETESSLAKLVFSGVGSALSLRAKITIFFTLYIAVTFAVLTGAVIQLESRRTIHQSREDASSALDELAKAVYGRWNPSQTFKKVRDSLEAHGIKERLYRNPNIVYAAFQDMDGRLQYVPKRHFTLGWMVDRTLIDARTKRMLSITGSGTRSFVQNPEGKVTEFLVLVRGKDQSPIGVARLGFLESNTGQYQSGYGRRILGQIFGVNLFATLLGCGMIFFVASRLEVPIKTLQERASAMSGSFVRANETQDVLALLNREFSGIERMIHRLKANRTEMARTLNHEFRNPLQAIVGNVDLIRFENRKRVTPEMNESLATIRHSAEVIEDLLENVLDLVALDENRMPVQKKFFRVEEVVQKTSQIFQHKSSEYGIRIEEVIPQGLDGAMGDPNRILQVLINLVSNSLKYAPQGGWVKIGAGNRDGFVECYVEDNGPGIPEEYRMRIFEEFFQVPDSEPVRGEKGVGIGLSLCKRLIDAHGGRIWIESRNGDGKGTVVRFTLEKAVTL